MLKTLSALGSLAILLALAASGLQAAPIGLVDGDGDDSGWTVESAGAALDLTSSNIIDVDLTAKTVTITVAKDFGPYEEILGSIVFPVGALTFNQGQADNEKIDRIIIQSETIANHSGAAWTKYTWDITTAGAAQFNTSQSSGWDVSPFGTKTFVTAHQLEATGGSGIANGATFAPSGNLVIDIDLSSSSDPITLTLKQRVVPEPGTLVCLGIAGALLLGRRSRRK